MKYSPNQKYLVINLQQIRQHKLNYSNLIIANLPVSEIIVDDHLESTAIASWRRDVNSKNYTSQNLNECISDAIDLGFDHLLVDIVSIPENDKNLMQRVIDFSRYYSILHAVISYVFDAPDSEIRRTWLKNEAFRIMQSPTKLRYALHKWKIAIGLRPSLLIRQVCHNRIGISNVNFAKLQLCDYYISQHMTLSELAITQNTNKNKPFEFINLDLRRQTYASDSLLVFEVNRSEARAAIVEQLIRMESNSVVVPALVAIWAFVEGLSISIRRSDWNCEDVADMTKQLMSQLFTAMGITFECRRGEEGLIITCEGEISGSAVLEIDDGNLFVHSRREPLLFENPEKKEEFLKYSLHFAEQERRDRKLSEKINETAYHNFEALIFDDYSHKNDVYNIEEIHSERIDLASYNVDDETANRVDFMIRNCMDETRFGQKINAEKLLRVVEAYKFETHYLCLVYLAHGNEFLAEVAMAIADIWCFVYKNSHLQEVSYHLFKEVTGGKAVAGLDVWKVYSGEG